MSMPSPFEMGRAIGGNISKGISGGLENRRIDDLLQEAQATGDPNQINNFMNQILTSVSPEKRPMVQQALQQRQQQMQQQQLAKYYESQGMSPDLINAPKEIQLQAMKNQPNQLQAAKLEAGKAKLGEVFNRLEDIKNSGYTGKSATSLLTAQGRESRAEVNTLGEEIIANLIPLLNPRGTMSQSRFNYIKNLAPRGTDTDATFDGKMAALKRIFDLPSTVLGNLDSMSEDQFKNIIPSHNSFNPNAASKNNKMFVVNGQQYNIPKDQIEEFKKDMGIK